VLYQYSCALHSHSSCTCHRCRYGLPWAFAGWLDPQAGPDTPAKNAFANVNVSANYTVSWLEGAMDVHGLTIDYIGQWNERDAPEPYAAALRAAVAQKSPETFV
jgi:hypothetical protein